MSLIKKIVDVIERNDNVDARKNITRLNKEIKEFKDKVMSYIDSNYKEFLPALLTNEQLLDEGSILEDELLNLKRSLEGETTAMYQASDEISKMVEELFETQLKLVISLKLVKIDKYMEKIRQSNDAQNYSEINSYINKIQLLIDDPQDKIFRRLDIYENLKKRLSFEKVNLQKKLEAQFNTLFSLRSKSFPKTKAIHVTITKELESLMETTNAMLEIDYNFNEIADFMMTNLFEPVVSRAVSIEFVENAKDFSMTLSYSTSDISDDLRPNHSTVFTNIQLLFCFLSKMNLNLKNDEHLLPYILKDHYDDFLRLILNECLVHSIPTTFEERDQSTLTEDIEKLSQIFVKLNFKEGEENLEKYPAKIDKLFYKKFIKNITNKSAEILKRDLHDMIMVSEDTTLSTETPLTFPKSMISKSTLEVVRLLEKIIAEAKKCDESSNEKRQNLLIAVKAVLENYPFSIQLHHSRFMSQIPQQSALFYNNCMYLSNWAMNNRDTENCPGIEVVSEDLETQGLEILEVQIAKQKIQLIDVLKDFDVTQALNVVNPEVFKPIRQCLRQMDLLKNVWQTILPTNLYNKTMAGLLNVICSNFVNKVSAMEDISANLSTALVELIKTIDEKSQALFDADISCLSIVDEWQRLLHLQFILDGSLIEISQSWKNKQLSQSFSAEDVKRLIRALFQNTERRATALSAIV